MSVNDSMHPLPSRTPWLTALQRWFDTTVDDEPAAASTEPPAVERSTFHVQSCDPTKSPAYAGLFALTT
jgi:hypothetical protein